MNDVTRLVLFAAAMGLTAGGCLAAGPSNPAGVSGQIMLTPACPGPQRIDQTPCSDGLAGARVQLLTDAGEVLVAVEADAQGRFVIQAPPGAYRLHVDVEGLYPRCEDARLKISAHRQVQVRLVCDSGMR